MICNVTIYVACINMYKDEYTLLYMNTYILAYIDIHTLLINTLHIERNIFIDIHVPGQEVVPPPPPPLLLPPTPPTEALVLVLPYGLFQPSSSVLSSKALTKFLCC